MLTVFGIYGSPRISIGLDSETRIPAVPLTSQALALREAACLGGSHRDSNW